MNKSSWLNPTFGFRSVIFLVGFALFGCSFTNAGEISFQERKERLISLLRQNDFKAANKAGKYNLPNCLARLEATRGMDPEALEYLANAFDYLNTSWGDEGDPFFVWIGIVRGYLQYGNGLSAAQKDHIRSQATGFRRWFKGDTGIYPNHTNPVPGGTENHHLMTWSSLYLFAQAWPDAEWYRSDQGNERFSSAQAMARVKELLRAHGRQIFSYGNNEFLSPTYLIFHLIPLVNLWEFSKDQEMRDIATAYLAYHFASLSLNDFDGHILAPFTRSSAQRTKSELSHSQYVNWLYWGQNSPSDADIGSNSEGGRYAIYLALSSFRPWAWADSIARGRVSLPFAAREVKPFWEASPPRYAMRTIWREQNFAMGTGNLRTLPGYYVIDDQSFDLVYRSTDAYNYLQCMHNYWYSDKGDNFWRAPTSPFQQIVQDRNAAIVMFRIPDSDPHRDAGWNAAWLANRDGHFNALSKVVQCRFPSTIDEVERIANWFFLREGDVFIGIHPLAPASLSKGQDFSVLKSEARTSGFVFDVSNASRWETFDAFKLTLAKKAPVWSADSLEVRYRSTNGAEMRLRYNAGLEPPDHSVPRAWVDERELDFGDWPVMESPFVNMQGAVLVARVSESCFEVDWSAALPEISESCSGSSSLGSDRNHQLSWSAHIGHGFFFPNSRDVLGRTRAPVSGTMGSLYTVPFTGKN